MKKQVLVVSTLLITAFSFAQKNELKDADKALKGGDVAGAKAAIEAASPLMANADDKYKAEFYFLKGKTYFDMAQKGMDATNSFKTSLESFNELIEFEKSYKQKYTDEAKEVMAQMSGALVNSAVEDNKQNNYASAADKLYMAYQLDKENNKDYLYFAASSAVNGGDYDTALDYYTQLKDIGYTGVSTQYVATNVETGEEEVFSSKQQRDLMIKANSHNNPAEKVTESRLPEIVKNIALIYTQKGDTEKAIEAIQDARAANPDDINLLLTEANLYIKMDDKVKFQNLMEEAIQKDPNNPSLYYNLGVITAEQGDAEKAKEYYKKSLALDPENENTNLNMASLILSGEQDIVDQMNSLGTSSADNKKYDELKSQREDIHRSSIPYLEKVLEINPENPDAIRTLMNIYRGLGESAKFKEMQAKLESIQQ
ncbi:Tetratricopeptide repeat-containing protein [Zhouia amylolytica]|uniref:Tetratricopeptide repeat-containing protein n=1 Tax=Zhouia amylolytica TaxID=376730 RepID=A0A1I6T2G1_9FLAO|nr:tetratricopeptide repeat protein [Zhouia amylolytica]SFS83366.1 Tetratricopeptide repeat-containing protein [Zhouia amylolytica]